MPKRQRPRRIPTPVWEERPKGRVRRELGGRFYLVVVFAGLVVLAGLVIVFGFVKEYLDERALPGSTAVAVEDSSYDLDYFAARLRLYNEQTGGPASVFGVSVVSDQIVEEETVLRFADELDVSIPAEGVDAELANRLEIEADAPGFADVYQAELDRIGLIDEEYRQIVEARLLADKIRVKLSADIPPDAEQVRYSLIQVETESEAQQVLARLQAGEDFAALAGEVSIDARSKDQGGDSGWLAKGSVDRAVEEVLFSLETGAISDSFPTPNGVFVFQVQEKEIRPLDDSQRRQVETQTYQRWLEDQQQGLEIKNYVAIDSDKLDQNKLRWALDHGQPVTTQPTVPQPLVPSP